MNGLNDFAVARQQVETQATEARGQVETAYQERASEARQAAGGVETQLQAGLGQARTAEEAGKRQYVAGLGRPRKVDTSALIQTAGAGQEAIVDYNIDLSKTREAALADVQKWADEQIAQINQAEIQFRLENVELETGEWVPRSVYEGLPDDAQRQQLNEVGIDKFNQLAQIQPIATEVPAPVAVSDYWRDEQGNRLVMVGPDVNPKTAEYVKYDTWLNMSKPDQDYLMQHGIDAYNSRQPETVGYYEVETASGKVNVPTTEWDKKNEYEKLTFILGRAPSAAEMESIGRTEPQKLEYFPWYPYPSAEETKTPIGFALTLAPTLAKGLAENVALGASLIMPGIQNPQEEYFQETRGEVGRLLRQYKEMTYPKQTTFQQAQLLSTEMWGAPAVRALSPKVTAGEVSGREWATTAISAALWTMPLWAKPVGKGITGALSDLKDMVPVKMAETPKTQLPPISARIPDITRELITAKPPTEPFFTPKPRPRVELPVNPLEPAFKPKPRPPLDISQPLKPQSLEPGWFAPPKFEVTGYKIGWGEPAKQPTSKLSPTEYLERYQMMRESWTSPKEWQMPTGYTPGKGWFTKEGQGIKPSAIATLTTEAPKNLKVAVSEAEAFENLYALRDINLNAARWDLSVTSKWEPMPFETPIPLEPGAFPRVTEFPAQPMEFPTAKPITSPLTQPMGFAAPSAISLVSLGIKSVSAASAVAMNSLQGMVSPLISATPIAVGKVIAGASPLTKTITGTEPSTFNETFTATEAQNAIKNALTPQAIPQIKSLTKGLVETKNLLETRTMTATAPAVKSATLTQTGLKAPPAPKMPPTRTGKGGWFGFPPTPTLEESPGETEGPLPEGTDIWKQGAFWKAIPPKESGVKPFSSRKAPAGARTGGRTPQETFQVVGGQPMIEADVDLGMVDVFVDEEGVKFKGHGERTDVGKRIRSKTKGMTIRRKQSMPTASAVRI